MKNKNLITNEKAITTEEQDSLNYYPFAQKIQSIIQGYSNNPESLTIGIYGKWGAGKSSFLNLIEKNIELFEKDSKDKKYIKFHYNPWIYQTKEEMLFDFFNTLSKKLIYNEKDTLKKAGKLIKKYSAYLKAVKLSASVGIPKTFNAGISIEPYEILKKLGEDLEGPEITLEDLKTKIDTELIDSNKKIIVFIDDVDRLDKDEIFTLFKLIKINADFKNLIFIICLDPEQVSNAIHSRYGNNKKSGLAFLEKIINIPIELPLVEDSDLDFYVKEKLKVVFSSKMVKQERINELLDKLKGYYFDSPREVIRVVNSFAISFYAIGDEVNLHDLFWIEYLKIKFPETYNLIKQFAKDFNSKNILFQYYIDFNKPTIDGSNKETGLREVLLTNHGESFPIIEFLFPMVKSGSKTIAVYGASILKNEKILDLELRINHINHFEKYFSFHTIGKISEITFQFFLSSIESDNFTLAKEELVKIISKTNLRKVVFRITNEIESANKLSLKFILFLIENISLFNEISDYNPYWVDVIKSISNSLRQKEEDLKDFVIEKVLHKLNYEQACWFIGSFTFGDFPNYIDELHKVLIIKIQTSDDTPFFKYKGITKMVLEIWNKIDKVELEKYILENINTKENCVHFIISFPDVWNLKIIGVFKEKDYLYLSETLKLDTGAIFNKFKTFYPEIEDIQSLKKEYENWDNNSENSSIQNIKQFAYWHHIYSNRQDVINKLE